MLEFLDEAVKDLLVQKMPLNLAEVDISFDVPNREWSSAISKPTINVYMHDIRENMEYRTYNLQNERMEDGTIRKVKVGAKFDLSYIITAWTANIEDEHRLLWYVLTTLFEYVQMPDDILPENLQNLTFPLLMKVAQPEGILRNAADVWTALDNQLKPVITLVITMSMDSRILRATKEVRSKFIQLNPPDTGEIALARAGKYQTVPASAQDRILQIGGYITNEQDEPLSAEVIVLEQGLNTRTNELGRFSFGNVVLRPKVTILAVANGYETLRKEVTLPAESYDLQLKPEAARV